MTKRRFAVLVLVGACLILVLAGCGGNGTPAEGGGDDGIPNTPAPDIAVDDAVAAPDANAPAAPDADLTCKERLEALLDNDESDIPANADELEAELAWWVDRVNNDPNNTACQLGLTMTLLATAGYNAADYLGENIFARVGLQDIAAVGLSNDSKIDSLLAEALDTALLKGTPAPATVTGSGVTTADVTINDMQMYRAAVRDYVDPCVADAVERMAAIADNAANPATLLLSLDVDGQSANFYAAEFNSLAAGLQLLRCGLLMAYAVNPDYGTYDWDVDLYLRDANENGVLTVAEYAPPAPFGAIIVAAWQNAGACLRDAVARLSEVLDTYQAADADALATGVLEGVNVAELGDALTAVGELLAGPVNFTYEWDDVGGSQVDSADTHTEQIPVNFRKIWDGMPATGLRAWLPPMYFVLAYAHYALSNGDEVDIWGAGELDGTVTYHWDNGTENGDVNMPLGPAPHNFAVPEFDVQLAFNWDWSQITGTVDGEAVTGAPSPPGEIHRMWCIAPDELPDPTFGGIFPDPDAVLDMLTGLMSGEHGNPSLKYGEVQLVQQ